MSVIHGLIHRVRVLILGERYTREQEAELRFHLELEAMHNARDGDVEREAEHLARRRLGNLTIIREELRRAAGLQFFDRLRQDVSYALRGLRRSPGFASAVVLTLALGIGANAAIFVAADRMFLRAPTGISDPSSLRRLYLRTSNSVGERTEIDAEFSYPFFQALAAGSADRALLVASARRDSLPLGSGDAATMVRASYVTDRYFPILGVRPAAGRFFTSDEDRMGNGAPVAIISHALWRRQFGGDADVIGREVDIAWQRHTIIGVAAEGFAGTDLDAADVWLPLSTIGARSIGASAPWYETWRSITRVQIFARVAPGTRDDWLSSVGTAIWRRGEQVNHPRRPDTSAVLMTGPLLELRAPSVTPNTAAAVEARLIGVAAIVLLIACANVANLLFVRVLGRRREIAVRLTLGVSRRRLFLQLLTESVVLSLLAGAVALIIGVWGGSVLRAMLMPGVHWAAPAWDVRIALFTSALSLGAGVLIGLAPARSATRLDVVTSLRGGARTGTLQRSRIRHALIVAQVALAVVLLAGAGLFVRSLHRVRGIDLGYDTDRIVFAYVKFVNEDGHFLDSRPESRAVELAAGLADAAARIRRLPGVEETALATFGPMAGYAGIRLWRRDGTIPPPFAKRDPALIGVSPSFFRAAGVRLSRGRLFSDDDRVGSAPVVVVNETAAKTYWPDEDALGQCLILLRRTDPCVTVVGITRNSHLDDIVETPTVEFFTPLAQGPAQGPFMSPSTLVVRTSPERARAVAEETRRELRRIFPSAWPAVTPLSVRLEPQVRSWRLGAELFSALGVLALVIAAVGVYSVVSYAFSQRAHEMGVRVALGARRADVMRLVLGEGFAIVAVGVVAGVVLALASARFVGSLLYEVSARDPLALGVGGLVLLAAGLLASILPAWRATRVDPVIALRGE